MDRLIWNVCCVPCQMDPAPGYTLRSTHDTHIKRANMRRCTLLLTAWILLYLASLLAVAQPTQQNETYEELQRKYEAALQENVRLRSELEVLKRERASVQPSPPGMPESAPGNDPLQVGNAHFSAQRYAEAIAAYTKAIAAAPRDARAYKHRGLAHAKLGNAPQAYKDMSKAIELDPQDAIAHNQRGITSFATGNTSAALKDFTKAIELQPQLAEAYNNRGIIERKLGDYRQASKDFERAAQLGMDLAKQHLQVLQDEVRQAQERLRSTGFNPGAANGVLAKQTVTALRQYQKAHGLPVTGLLDNATRNALGLPSEVTAAPQAAESPRFVHQPRPEYPDIARHNGWEGTVTLRLELLTDGTVGEVQVAHSSGQVVLDTAAQEAAKTWKHVPASQGDTPVTRWAEMNLTFQLDKGQDRGGTKP
jgi:TonB family protein